MQWPDGKQFAFTIVDDTDCAVLRKIAPIYDLLYQCNMRTTKTVWVYGSRNTFYGDVLHDNDDYSAFIRSLSARGFEIASHCAGSGSFQRAETIAALDEIRALTGNYPRMHVNHADNQENMYWGAERFAPLVAMPYALLYKLRRQLASSCGHIENSPYFWGDICKERIDYMRNHSYNTLNLLDVDKHTPYTDRAKEKYSNFWYNACNGLDYNTFMRLVTPTAVDQLAENGGYAIIYVHFAFGFSEADGTPKQDFRDIIRYISGKNGYFVPVSDTLDYLRTQGRGNRISSAAKLRMDVQWMIDRCTKQGAVAKCTERIK